jgi:hypothetical protein
MYWEDLEKPEAFSEYMETVDARLKARGVDIPARPLHAMMLVSEELHTRFLIPNSEHARRINEWFQKRYGGRLKVDFCIGRMLILVAGDPYVARYPLVYGTVQLNLLQVIQGVTPATLQALPQRDLQAVLDLAKEGFEACNVLSRVPRQLVADRDTAVDQVMARPPDLGLSKWSSLQSVEKMLNAFLEKASGGSWKLARKKGAAHQHDLAPLIGEAEGRGLAAVDRQHLKRVECTASVRYPGRPEAMAVTLADAVGANQSSLFLCASVAKQL